MVKCSTQKTGKFFNMSKQSELDFVKASNVLLEPFSPIKKGQDLKAEKQLRMPPNPLGVQLRNKSIISLYDFCKERNIPFNENEKRYYLRAKQENSDKKFDKTISAYFKEINMRHRIPESLQNQRTKSSLECLLERCRKESFNNFSKALKRCKSFTLIKS